MEFPKKFSSSLLLQSSQEIEWTGYTSVSKKLSLSRNLVKTKYGENSCKNDELDITFYWSRKDDCLIEVHGVRIGQ